MTFGRGKGIFEFFFKQGFFGVGKGSVYQRYLSTLIFLTFFKLFRSKDERGEAGNLSLVQFFVTNSEFPSEKYDFRMTRRHLDFP